MAKMNCTICNKPFRRENGLGWHIEHAHPGTEDRGSGEPSGVHENAGAGEPGYDELTTRLAALEETVAGLSNRQAQDVVGIRVQLEHQDHSEALSRLEQTAERLEMQVASLSSDLQRVGDLGGTVNTMAREVAEQRRLVMSAARLAGNLDLDRRVSEGEHLRFGERLRSSAAELDQARALVRESLQEDSLVADVLGSMSD